MRVSFLTICLAVLALPGQATCRLALSLGLDVSGSVDVTEYRLQLDGIATALETTEVQAALFEMPQATVSLSIFQWGSAYQQELVVDWTEIKTPADLSEIIAKLNSAQSTFDDPQTAIGAAIEFGLSLLAERPECWRHTLDISGDGPSNIGPLPQSIDLPEQPVTTVNGLVINPDSPDNISKDRSNTETLLDHYETKVIRGPGAFVEKARDFRDFSNAMTRKLIREVNTLMISGPPRPEHKIHPRRQG